MSVNLSGMSTLSSMLGTQDYSQIIQQLYQADRAPGDALNTLIQTYQQRANDWQSINQSASTVQNDLVALTKSSLYTTMSATVNGQNTSSGSTSNSSGTSNTLPPVTATSSNDSTVGTPGTYTLTVNSGKAATVASGSSIGAAATLNSQVSSGVFGQSISTGNISVDVGGQVTTYSVQSSDTLDTVLTNLFGGASGQNAAGVSWSVNNNKLVISNSGSNAISFGTAGDASNLFKALGLTTQQLAAGSSSTPTTATSSILGHVQLQSYLSSATANFGTSVTPTTSGDLRINGVDISYNTQTDTLQGILNRINTSKAGVTASYDPQSDTMTLTSATSQAVNVQDITGNLGAALQLTTNGQATAGTPWTYQINGGAVQSSPSATVTDAIPGISFTIQPNSTNATATLNVTQDTSNLTNAIQQFVNDFNGMYKQLQQYTGRGGDLQGDVAMAQLGFQYMQDVLGVVPNTSQYANQSVQGIGINNGAIGSTPGSTNTLQLDKTAFSQAFANDPNEVQSLLSGMATTLNAHLQSVTGQFNELSPLTAGNFNLNGLAQEEAGNYQTMIKNVEQQQQSIYTYASNDEQQLANQFTALQSYEQSAALQQNVVKALFGIG